MKILFVDLDNTIAEFSGHLVKKINEKYGTSISTCQIEYNYSACSNAAKLLKVPAKEIYEIIYSEGFFLELAPIKGAIESLQYLKKTGFQIRIMTSVSREKPPSIATKDKYLWVEKYLKGIVKPESIIFAQEKELLINENSLLIDDAPHFLNNNKLSGRIIGYRRKYNKTITGMPFIEAWDPKHVFNNIILLETGKTKS